MLRYVAGKTDARGYNRAAVALANKNARMIKALLSSDTPYRSSAVAR